MPSLVFATPLGAAPAQSQADGSHDDQAQEAEAPSDPVADYFVGNLLFDVVVRDCGEENAYCTPDTGEITMCYEWLATFLADAQKQAE